MCQCNCRVHLRCSDITLIALQSSTILDFLDTSKGSLMPAEFLTVRHSRTSFLQSFPLTDQFLYFLSYLYPMRVFVCPVVRLQELQTFGVDMTAVCMRQATDALVYILR